MTAEYDLIVIGAGVAGVAAAHKCVAEGWKVAIVDELPYGGTCVLRGCDPKKILRRGAEIIDGARLMRGKGIGENGLAVNWADLMAHKEGFTRPMSQRIDDGLVRSGVTAWHGQATFMDTHHLDVDGTVHAAKHFLIATGALPKPLSFPGHEHVIDSSGFLNLTSLPPRILFIGGGFISFEFAHIAARAGSSTTILQHNSRPLKSFDHDLVELLVARSMTIGIDVRTETTITAITPAPGGRYRVHLDRAGNADSLEVDLVVHGAGREPNLSGLGLEAVGVMGDKHGVTVADHLQSTTNPAVYAAGDAAHTPGLPLTPVATAEGEVAASNMLKSAMTVPDYTGIPTVVFTIPELARVGLLEDEAREAGIDVVVRYSDTSDWYSNYRTGETTAAAKILIDRATDRIVGAHLLGPDYAELVNTFAMAIKLGLTTRQLKSAPSVYPSVGADLGSML